MKNGRTTPALFRHHLETHHGIDTLPPLSDVNEDLAHQVATLRNEMAASSLLNSLRTFDEFTVGIKALDQLHSNKWFCDGLVLLCLHLAQRRPYVRVGFSVPLHQDTSPSVIQHKPFEMTARRIKEWNDAEKESRLVCFFPVLLHGNHFTLLEINQRDDSIYHYDSLGNQQGELEVRCPQRRDRATLLLTGQHAACKYQFPGMKFVAKAGALKRVQRQQDNHSCGPLVVSFARRRMMGLQVLDGVVDADEALQLRFDAFNLISEAWRSGGLKTTNESFGVKRKDRGGHAGREKRTKLRD